MPRIVPGAGNRQRAAGGTRERRAIAFERVMDPATAYLGISLLQGVVDHGTRKFRWHCQFCIQ